MNTRMENSELFNQLQADACITIQNRLQAPTSRQNRSTTRWLSLHGLTYLTCLKLFQKQVLFAPGVALYWAILWSSLTICDFVTCYCAGKQVLCGDRSTFAKWFNEQSTSPSGGSRAVYFGELFFRRLYATEKKTVKLEGRNAAYYGRSRWKRMN